MDKLNVLTLLTLLYKDIKEEEIQKYFSDLPGSGSGYVLFYQSANFTTDSIQTWNPVEGKKRSLEEGKDSNGRPTVVPNHTSFLTSTSTPSRLDPGYIESGGSDESSTLEVIAEAPMSPRMEEKKYRWGLGRKIRDRKDKKH